MLDEDRGFFHMQIGKEETVESTWQIPTLSLRRSDFKENRKYLTIRELLTYQNFNFKNLIVAALTNLLFKLSLY